MTTEEQQAISIFENILKHEKDISGVVGDISTRVIVKPPYILGSNEIEKMKPLLPLVKRQELMIKKMASRLTTDINDVDWIIHYYEMEASKELCTK